MKLKFLVIYLISTLCLVAMENGWRIVDLPSLGTFEIPKSMEVQQGKTKILQDKFYQEIVKLPVNQNRVVIQQGGANDFKKGAFKRYSRIIVETDIGRSGEYENIYTKILLSKSELQELNSIFRKQIKNEAVKLINSNTKVKMKILSWQPVNIVNINGISMIHVNYTRSINGKPSVVVHIYTVQNNDRLHRIIISYRITEASIWKKDLDEVIYRFKFK